MGQTVANYAEVMKETWTSDRLEAQFYKKNPWLDKLERTNKFTIGEEAKVPLLKDYSGGYTVTNAAGGSLNAADEVDVDVATYTLTYNWQRTDLQFGVLNQANGGNTSVGVALDEEVTGAIGVLRRQVQRQSLSNGDALIAECATSTTTNTINLSPTGYGYDALVRKWLFNGLTIDIGTAANEVSVAADREITAVHKNVADPEIVISGATVSTAAGDFVSIANARTGASAKEMNGLRTIAGSTTSAIGGLDPDNAGEEFWQPALVDSTTTVLSLDTLLALQEAVMQETGELPDTHLTSVRQQSRYYSLLQTQVRFPGEMKLGAGNVDQPTWNGVNPMAIPDVPNREWYALTAADMLLVTGKYTKPVWMSDIEGTTKGLRYTTGNTNFEDAVVYALQLGIRRRNSHAAAITLTG